MIKEFLRDSGQGDYVDENGDVMPFDGSWDDLGDYLADIAIAKEQEMQRAAEASIPAAVAEIFDEIDAERLQLEAYGTHEARIKLKMRKHYVRIVKACREAGVDSVPFIRKLGGYDADTATPAGSVEPAPAVSPAPYSVEANDSGGRDLDWGKRQYKDDD